MSIFSAHQQAHLLLAWGLLYRCHGKLITLLHAKYRFRVAAGKLSPVAHGQAGKIRLRHHRAHLTELLISNRRYCRAAPES